MMESQIQTTVTAHAQACNSPSRPIANGAVMTIYVRDELLRHIGFVSKGGINRTIDIPTFNAIGAYYYHLHILGQLGQLRFYLEPRAMVAPKPMQQIEHRQFDRLIGTRRNDHTTRTFMHCIAVNRNGIDLGSLSGCYRHQAYHQKQTAKNKSIHLSNFNRNPSL
jgi:hypothetical protein